MVTMFSGFQVLLFKYKIKKKQVELHISNR